MARMYSRKKGRSGSKRPAELKHDWLLYNKEEVEELIIKLAKQGKTSSEIGLILRDDYGVPLVKEFGLTITQVLEKNKLNPEIPEDLFNLIKKAVNVREHLEANKRDSISKRGLEITESKIRRLVKYYVKKGKLPKDWKYSPQKARLLVK